MSCSQINFAAEAVYLPESGEPISVRFLARAPTANSSSGIRGLSRFVHPGFNSAQHDGSHVSLLR